MRVMTVLIIFIISSLSICFGSCKFKETGSEGENENAIEKETNDLTSPPLMSTTSTSTSTTTSKPKEGSRITEGESRASSGQKIKKTPPYLGHIFGPSTQRTKNDPDHGKLSGFSIHLDQNHAIVHQATLERLQASGSGKKIASNGRIVLPALEEVKVNRPLSRKDLEDYESVHRGVGGSQFNLAKFNFGRRAIDPIGRAKLEKNKQEFGDNCHMLSYHMDARSRIDWSAFGFGSNDELGNDQHMAKIHLNKPDASRCKNGVCTLTIDTRKSLFAGICNNHIQDMGAPILCGHEKRVTYLAQPSIDKAGGCFTRHFSAFHVPHLVEDVEKHIKLD